MKKKTRSKKIASGSKKIWVEVRINGKSVNDSLEPS